MCVCVWQWGEWKGDQNELARLVLTWLDAQQPLSFREGVRGGGGGLWRPITEQKQHKSFFFSLSLTAAGLYLDATDRRRPASPKPTLTTTIIIIIIIQPPTLLNPTVSLQTLGALWLRCINTICIVFNPPLQVSRLQSRPPARRGQPGTFGST